MAGTWINLPVSGGAGGSAYWEDGVANFAALPPGTVDGEIRQTLNDHQLYYWDAATTSWKLLPTAAIDPSDVADTNSVDLTVTAGVLSADVRLSSDAASANNVVVSLNIQSGASPGLRAQLANSLIRGLLSSASTSLSYNATTGAFTVVPGNLDHAALGNLTADAHLQYLLLAGRAGGQTAVGGTAASESLTLSSTSNGTKGRLVAEDPFRLPLRTTAQIAALTVTAGLMVYNTDTQRPQIYIAGTTNAWVDMLGWGA